MEQPIGDRIKEQRLLKNMTMQSLADAIGKSKGNVNGYEKGEYEPSAQTVVALANVFGVSTDWLLTGAEYQYQDEDIPIVDRRVQYQPDNESPQPELSKDEQDLLRMYRFLDDRDKQDINENVSIKFNRTVKKGRSYYSAYGDESMLDTGQNGEHRLRKPG